MTAKDTITLPREVVEGALEALEHFKLVFGGFSEEVKALRTALAAETPKHPGYIIGSHWLETAYSRICAGEAEANVLRDIGWERVDQALRRDAERYRWLRGEHSRIDPCIKANAKYRLERDSSTWVNIHDLDAAIDAAMKEGT